jgi:hypothetical protein
VNWSRLTSYIQPGARVASSRRFLQSMRCFTGDMPHGRAR